MSYDKALIAGKLRRWEKHLMRFRLPEWDEIPDFGLYMEQTVDLLRKYLDYLPPELKNEEVVTSSAINNYVRRGIMPGPIKKKYYRPHIACLLMICTLKQSSSEVRKRQEVGRGLRLCVNQNSERMDESVLGCEGAVMQVLSSIYDPRALRPENAHDNNVQAKVDEQKLHDREFTKLWQRINRKTLYTVSFDTQELIDRSVRGWTPT